MRRAGAETGGTTADLGKRKGVNSVPGVSKQLDRAAPPLTRPQVSLVLVCYSYPPVLGGSETEAQRVCAALQRRGHRVTIYCAGGHPMPPQTEWVDPYGVPVRIFGGKWPDRCRGYIFALGVAWSLLQQRRQYEVVYFLMKGVHLATGVPIAALLNKRIVMKFSGSGLIQEMARSWLGRLELNFLRRWAAAVMVLNPGMAKEAAAAGFQAERLLWMPNPVDTDEFCPCNPRTKAELRREFGLPEEARIVIFVGRLAPEKELPSLFEAFARSWRQCPEAMLVLVGEGPCRAALAEFARGAGIGRRVLFAGKVDPTSVPKWLQASDIFALVSSLEGLPCSLLEAMAVGLPAVVTAIPAMEQLVDDDVHGLLVEKKDEEAIARALRRLLLNPALRARLGNAARQRVLENFSTGRVAGLYEDLFHRLLQSCG